MEQFAVCLRNLSTQRDQWFSLPSQRPALESFVYNHDYLVVTWDHCNLDIPEFCNIDLLCRIGEIIADTNTNTQELYAIGCVLCDLQEVIERYKSGNYSYYPTDEFCHTLELGEYIFYEGLWEHESDVTDAIRDYIDCLAIGRDAECNGMVITKYGTVNCTR